MNKKILIIIIVAALAGAGFFGYLMLSGSGDSASEDGIAKSLLNQTDVRTQDNSQILPYGNTLNFGKVVEFNRDQKIFRYPTVNSSEIGSSVGAFIKQ